MAGGFIRLTAKAPLGSKSFAGVEKKPATPSSVSASTGAQGGDTERAYLMMP